MTLTPGGKWTTNSISTSLARVLYWPVAPGVQALGGTDSVVGYTAQIVTPPACRTTSKCTSGLVERPCRVALTSTLSRAHGSMRMLPSTPCTSTLCPAGTTSLQWNAGVPQPRTAPGANAGEPH